MQQYIYSYLFKRTLSDLDELLNIAEDDWRKDCLWDARSNLLSAERPAPTTSSELAGPPKVKRSPSYEIGSGNREGDEGWNAQTQKYDLPVRTGPPEPAIENAPKGPAEAANPKFQENCKSCVNCGGPRNSAIDGVIQDRCYDCDRMAKRTASAVDPPTAPIDTIEDVARALEAVRPKATTADVLSAEVAARQKLAARAFLNRYPLGYDPDCHPGLV